MLKYQVVATLSSEQSYVGEIVAFNCVGSDTESAKHQAMRFTDIFQRQGNGMIDKIVEATGATTVEYRIRIA